MNLAVERDKVAQDVAPPPADADETNDWSVRSGCA